MTKNVGILGQLAQAPLIDTEALVSRLVNEALQPSLNDATEHLELSLTEGIGLSATALGREGNDVKLPRQERKLLGANVARGS